MRPNEQLKCGSENTATAFDVGPCFFEHGFFVSRRFRFACVYLPVDPRNLNDTACRTTGSSTSDTPLSNEQINRYKRHLILPEVGTEGQKKLLNASVLCIGAGGLGCPIALYLAAAGVGTIGLADIDVVSPSNLQRQILFGTGSIGEDKVKAAAKRLKDLNPDVKIIEHKTIVDSSNVLDLVAAYDVIIDGTDNFPTRYCVNDACVILKKPNVYGSIFRFEGMVTVFAPHLANPLRPGENGPCYRCMYPEPPDPGSVPSCAEGGVLGVLPGIIGTLQANEVIKLILGIGTPAIGKLATFARDGPGVQDLQAAARSRPARSAANIRPSPNRSTTSSSAACRRWTPNRWLKPAAEAKAAKGASPWPIPAWMRKAYHPVTRSIRPGKSRRGR